MARQSVADLLNEFLALGDEVAYIQRRGYRAVRWSYRQVAESAFQFAQELKARQIGKGDRVLLWGPNSAEWVAAFFGCVARGAVVVPMDDTAAPDFVHRVFAQVSARLMACSGSHAQAMAPTPSCILEDLATALSHHPTAPKAALPTESVDMLEIVFTSGATAEPKGVVISHGNILANIAPLEAESSKYLKYERLVHPVRFLSLLPLSHVFGQFLGMFVPQLLGGTVVFQENLKPTDVIASIRRERVSVVVAVPRVLQSLKEKIEQDLDDEERTNFRRRFRAAQGTHFLRRWWTFRDIHRRFGWKFWAFISGGAALDSATEEFWGRLGYAVIQGYGLTETTSLISVNHPFKLGKGSIGKVLAGKEVKLASDGEIMVRGGGVTEGYWGSDGATAVADDEGWYRTGDVGEMDAEGRLYFKGRKKDVLVTPAGMKVYPRDLEAALRRQPEIKDCIVISLPRAGNAEACAVVILRHGSRDPEPAVRRANESLAEFQRMRFWFAWPEEDFPRTSTQKPRTSQIQQFVLAHLGQKLTEQMRSSPLEELVARVSGRSPARLTQESDLESDLNLSSLDRLELLSALEDRYQLDLGETTFASAKTVGDLERMLHGRLPARTRDHYPRWALRWPITWIRLLAYYFLMRPAIFLMAWPRVTGRENLRNVRGPVLVICNHIADVDLGFILTALPPRLRHKLATATRGEALEALRTPAESRNFVARGYDRVRWALGVSLLNLFPLPREAGFRESFAYAGECIDRGYSVLVFPEGRYTTSGEVLPFRSGIGLLAKNLKVPVVPMRIEGLFELKRAGKKFAAPGRIHVKIGAAVEFGGEEERSIPKKLQHVVEML